MQLEVIMSIWVREFMCGVCGKRHRVEGKRGILGKLQKEQETKCQREEEENEASARNEENYLKTC